MFFLISGNCFLTLLSRHNPFIIKIYSPFQPNYFFLKKER
jgi:hypothetical protein